MVPEGKENYIFVHNGKIPASCPYVLLLLMSIGIEVEEKHITRAEKCFCNLSSGAEKGGSAAMTKGQGPKLISKTAVRVEMGE